MSLIGTHAINSRQFDSYNVMRNGCFGFAGRLDKQTTHARTHLQGPWGLSSKWWWMANKPIQIMKSHHLGYLCRIWPSFGQTHQMEPVHPRTTLCFLATGTFQRELVYRSEILQPSFSATMPAVSLNCGWPGQSKNAICSNLQFSKCNRNNWPRSYCKSKTLSLP